MRRADLPGGGPRVVLELLTSMRRHGFTGAALRDAVATVPAPVTIEGIALHLPLASAGGDHVAEVERLMTEVVAADLADTPGGRTIWVSHLGPPSWPRCAPRGPTTPSGPGSAPACGSATAPPCRSGRPSSTRTRSSAGDVYGYRGRTAGAAARSWCVSGGTAHGIGLEAPTGDTCLRSRAATLARGGLDAAGLVRSPFTVEGRLRYFAEPPHMQASMLLLPSGVTPPAIGDRARRPGAVHHHERRPGPDLLTPASWKVVGAWCRRSPPSVEFHRVTVKPHTGQRATTGSPSGSRGITGSWARTGSLCGSRTSRTTRPPEHELGEHPDQDRGLVEADRRHRSVPEAV